MFRLLIRVISQMMFLTPKPNFVPPVPQHRPYIGAIFGPNILCIILHILTARSEAGEAMRGYLHGGIIVDLIGQKGPTSKFHLVLLDLLVLGLQCFMLGVHVEKETQIKQLKSLKDPTAASTEPRVEPTAAQDMDAEERGVLRDTVVDTSNEDIELNDLGIRRERTSGGVGVVNISEDDRQRDAERERLLAEPHPEEESDDDTEHPLDIFYSGTTILADFYIVQTLKKQWDDYGNATGSALQTVGFSAEFARMAANRRLNAATMQLQRQVDALTP